MTKREKTLAYQKATNEIDAILANETNMILKMTTINCMIKENFPNYFWIGFYCVNADSLIVGPYQGTLGCLHITMGRGVCGRAARLKTTQIVANVHNDPEHIACDASTNSEIVLPVLDKNGQLIAVFDLDSTSKAAFDEVDQIYLEALLKKHFQEKELVKQYVY